MTRNDDTIVAIATPPGTGGIGIVRISGVRAAEIAGIMVGELPPPRTAVFRTFRDADGEPLDDGVALLFPGPASFTGETVVELHGHGGRVVLAGLVDTAVALGARPARPGEFSERAFLNGKLDLAQAEAVADLIGSSTAQAARAALRSLAGAFSAAVESLADDIGTLRAHVEATIDFADEDIDFLADEAIAARAGHAAEVLETLIGRARVGRVLRDGYRVVIVGRPNAGKSSLMNCLSGEDTAIVTEVAGTTRDILREQVSIGGLAVELVDTAGLREDPDRIEAEGIRRAREAMSAADAVLWIRDAAQERDGEPPERIPDGVPVLVVRNKIDLTGEKPGAVGTETDTINVSALSGAGLDELRDALSRLAGTRDLGEGVFTARRRHVDALQRAAAHLETGRAALAEERAGELFAEELRLAQQALGEITGEVGSEELLGRIFSEFCIGK
jgi:tRNA modification GTPase